MNQINNKVFPRDLVLFISGVPGSGKTTISYELLKKYDQFRIVQDTDLVREILRGYNEFISNELSDYIPIDCLEKMQIPDHNKIFTYSELKEQCRIFSLSLENIVVRQQRKHIPTIINGIHAVPEVLTNIAKRNNVVFVNLYIKDKKVLIDRISSRNASKYSPFLSVLFETDYALSHSMQKLSKANPHQYYNIDVSNDTIDQTTNKIIAYLEGIFS